MPISKTGHLYFTDSQYKQARACGALEYAKRAGYDLVRDCGSYHLREHDSMVFTSDGRWFWNSRGFRGRALEFMLHYEGRTLPEAVNLLTGKEYAPLSAPAPSVQKPKAFELPERSPSFKRLFAYLCQTRMLDYEIVQTLVKQHRIYESIRTYKNTKTQQVCQAHNVIFVAFDEDGQARAAYQRGTNTKGEAFKHDVVGSNKTYLFQIPGQSGTEKVCVFEAAIDAISHASLTKLAGESWTSSDRIALGGVALKGLLHYLEHHPKIWQIELCLDRDAPGVAAAKRLTQDLLEHGYTPDRGYTITTIFPDLSTGKDWNDALMEARAKQNKNLPYKALYGKL